MSISSLQIEWVPTFPQFIQILSEHDRWEQYRYINGIKPASSIKECSNYPSLYDHKSCSNYDRVPRNFLILKRKLANRVSPCSQGQRANLLLTLALFTL
jgi:hypothetical protein